MMYDYLIFVFLVSNCQHTLRNDCRHINTLGTIKLQKSCNRHELIDNILLVVNSFGNHSGATNNLTIIVRLMSKVLSVK